jgi:hypothetical protein
MKIRELPAVWQKQAGELRTARKYEIQLPVQAAAGIGALAEMYPGRTETQIITDLLSAALEELMESYPYIQGQRVVAEDEFGDPVYEDVGATPRFIELVRKYAQTLEAELK